MIPFNKEELAENNQAECQKGWDSAEIGSTASNLRYEKPLTKYRRAIHRPANRDWRRHSNAASSKIENLSIKGRNRLITKTKR